MTFITFWNSRLIICSLAVTMWNWSLSKLGVYILLWTLNLILFDPVWRAGSGLAILKNFPISNCGRCLTKAWRRRMKIKRRIMRMQMTQMQMMTMSWMTWLWCLTEAGETFRTIDCAGAATPLKCAATPWLSRRWCPLCQNMFVLSELAEPLKVSTFIVYCTNKYARWYLNHQLFILSEPFCACQFLHTGPLKVFWFNCKHHNWSSIWKQDLTYLPSSHPTPLHLTHWAFKRYRHCQFVTLSVMCLLVENLNLIERRKRKQSHIGSLVSCVFCLYEFSLQLHLDKHRQLGLVRLSIYRTFKSLSIGVAKSRYTSLISDYRHGLNNHLSKQHIWLFGVWRRDCPEGDFRLQHASNKVRLTASETRLEAAVGV